MCLIIKNFALSAVVIMTWLFLISVLNNGYLLQTSQLILIGDRGLSMVKLQGEFLICQILAFFFLLSIFFCLQLFYISNNVHYHASRYTRKYTDDGYRLTYATLKARKKNSQLKLSLHWPKQLNKLQIKTYCYYYYYFKFLQGSGHSPPEYKRRECYDMFDRWIHYYPLQFFLYLFIS